MRIVARLFPGSDVAAQRIVLGHAPGEALASESTKLDLGPVEPRPVLGRMVDLNPVGQALCFCGWESLVKQIGLQLCQAPQGAPVEDPFEAVCHAWTTTPETFKRILRHRHRGTKHLIGR